MMSQYNSYKWHGTNNNGKKIQGIIIATNRITAKINLYEQNINIKKITKQFFLIKSIKTQTKDIYLFTKQLAILINSGIPLIKCLEILIYSQKNLTFKQIIDTIKYTIISGGSLAMAFKQHPQLFNKLFCNLIAIGEQTGTIDIILNKIITHQDKIIHINKKIKLALTYPIIILLLTILITSVLLIFIIPQFQLLFANLNTELPVATLFIIQVAQLLQKFWPLLIIFYIICHYALIYGYKYSLKCQFILDFLILKIPVIGNLIRKTIISRIMSTLHITNEAGLPLLESLQATRNIVHNIFYNQAISNIYTDINTGQQLEQAFKNTLLFPHFVTQMIAIGEESGNLEQIFNKIALYYDEEIDTIVNTIHNLLNPIIITILGIIIGGLVIIMYLPIFTLGSTM